jgi:hypothetical protein
MGPTPYTFPLVLLVLTTQLSLAIYMRSHHPFSLPFILTAYVFGGTLNQNTFLAIHEITHNLAFKSLKANKVLAIVSNLAIGIPYAMAFKGYHREHHKYLGEEGIDTDLPSRFEALVLNNVAGKTFFACVSSTPFQIWADDKHFPDPILRTTTWIHSNAKTNRLARYQLCSNPYFRLPPRPLLWLATSSLPHHVFLLCWKSSSMRSTLYCRTLSNEWTCRGGCECRFSSGNDELLWVVECLVF